MVGYLALYLFLFKLNRLVRLSAYSLSENFSQSGSTLNVNKDIMALLNHSKTECSNSNLSDSSVVKNLWSNILKVNAFTDVSLKKKVSSLKESAVNTMMIGLLKCSSHLHFWWSISVNNSHKIFNNKARFFVRDIAWVFSWILILWSLELGIESIILIVNVVKLKQGDTSSVRALT